MQDLEKTLGVPLFERIGRRVTLTDAGRILLDEARRFLQQAQKIQERFRDLSEDMTGDLRIGATISAASTFLPQVLAKIRRSNPLVNLSLLPGHSDGLAEKLRRNELDVAVLGSELDQPDLKTCCRIPDELVLVSAPDHALAGSGSLSPKKLEGVQFIFREPGSDSRSIVKNWLNQHEIGVNILLELA